MLFFLHSDTLEGASLGQIQDIGRLGVCGITTPSPPNAGSMSLVVQGPALASPAQHVQPVWELPAHRPLLGLRQHQALCAVKAWRAAGTGSASRR